MGPTQTWGLTTPVLSPTQPATQPEPQFSTVAAGSGLAPMQERLQTCSPTQPLTQGQPCAMPTTQPEPQFSIVDIGGGLDLRQERTQACSPAQPLTEPQPSAVLPLPRHILEACSPTQPATTPAEQRRGPTLREVQPQALPQVMPESPSSSLVDGMSDDDSCHAREAEAEPEDELLGPTQMWGTQSQATPSSSPVQRQRLEVRASASHTTCQQPLRRPLRSSPSRSISPTLSWHRSSRSRSR